MDRFDSLITIRSYEVIALILAAFPELDVIEAYNNLDVDRTVQGRLLIYRLGLPYEYGLIISEKYSYIDYQLVILYNYSFTNPRDELFLSYDNSLHHYQLSNFPHHKHLYPKNNYSPVSFSGELSDALREARWIIETGGSQ